jgi:hypothetical protein
VTSVGIHRAFFYLITQSFVFGELEANPIMLQNFLKGINRDWRSITTSRFPFFVAGHGKHCAPHSSFNMLFRMTFNFSDSKPTELYPAPQSDI